MQYVQIDEHSSNQLEIKVGVPQGSLLGPLLFNIFVNDMFNLNLYGKLTMYADDMCLIYNDSCIDLLQNHMQSDLDVIIQWMDTNALEINNKKTKFMIFKTKNKNIDLSNFHLQINSEVLEQVNVFKYLGLWVDSSLNWNYHIQNIQKKIRNINFILFQMRYCLPVKIKYMIFHSHVMNSVRYLLPIWGSAAKYKLNDIHVSINRCLKTIKGLPILTPSCLLYTNLLTLNELIMFETILFIFKIIHGLIRNNYLIRAVNDVHGYDTRQKPDLYIDFCRTTLAQGNMIFSGFKLYNQLPKQLKEEMRISKFKDKLYNYIQSLRDKS